MSKEINVKEMKNEDILISKSFLNFKKYQDLKIKLLELKTKSNINDEDIKHIRKVKNDIMCQQIKFWNDGYKIWIKKDNNYINGKIRYKNSNIDNEVIYDFNDLDEKIYYTFENQSHGIKEFIINRNKDILLKLTNSIQDEFLFSSNSDFSLPPKNNSNLSQLDHSIYLIWLGKYYQDDIWLTIDGYFKNEENELFDIYNYDNIKGYFLFKKKNLFFGFYIS